MEELTYPRMVYRVGTTVVLESGTYDHKIAESEADAVGWFIDQYAAKEAHEAARPSADAVASDDAPPTREELEQKARELDIKFDGRTGDKTLSERIAAALKG